MSDRLPKFEWYVLNSFKYRTSQSGYHGFPFSESAHIRPFNIFDNTRVYDDTIKLCKQYKLKHMPFDEFVDALKSIIKWQEWSRCEYEIQAGDLMDSELEFEKIDCYMQVLPNIRILAQYVLNMYYPRLNLK